MGIWCFGIICIWSGYLHEWNSCEEWRSYKCDTCRVLRCGFMAVRSVSVPLLCFSPAGECSRTLPLYWLELKTGSLLLTSITCKTTSYGPSIRSPSADSASIWKKLFVAFKIYLKYLSALELVYTQRFFIMLKACFEKKKCVLLLDGSFSQGSIPIPVPDTANHLKRYWSFPLSLHLQDMKKHLPLQM